MKDNELVVFAGINFELIWNFIENDLDDLYAQIRFVMDEIEE